ncbi:MAG: IPT/TIG domain-containing protein [Planctomycetes bacterium]|nr:IPT/TIG domain-containing protein [Planctomycetota bacterium]
MNTRTPAFLRTSLFLAALIGLGGGATAFAQGSYDWNGTVNSNWSTPGNWTPAGPPGPTDDVTIDGGFYSPNPDPVLDANATCNSINILGGGILSTGAFFLTVSGGVSVDLGSTLNLGPSGTLTVDGTCTWDDGSTLGVVAADPSSFLILNGSGPQTLPAGTYGYIEYSGTSTLTFAGSTAVAIADFHIITGNFVVSSGVFSVGGNLIADAGSTLTVSGGAELQVTGVCGWGPAAPLTANAGSTVRLSGSGQSLPEGGYGDLVIDGPGTMIGANTWADSLTVMPPGDLTLTGGWLSLTDLHLQSGTSLTLGSGLTLYVAGFCDWGTSVGGGDLYMDPGAVLDLDGAGPQTLPSQPVPYADVTIDNPSTDIDGNVTLDNLSLSSGTSMTTSGYTVTVTNDVTVDSSATLTVEIGGMTLIVGGDCFWGGYGGFTGVLAMDPGSLLRLNGTSPQTLPAGTYADVAIQNSTGVQLDGNVTVEDFLLESGSTLNTNYNMMTVTGNIVTAAFDGGTIVALLPTGSPPPPGDFAFPAVTASDLLMGNGSSLTLDGEGRVTLQQCTIGMGATLIASQGTPGVSDDGILEVLGDWLMSGSFAPGPEGEVVISGSGSTTFAGDPITFFDLSLQKAAPTTVTATADITIEGSFWIGPDVTFSSTATFYTGGAGGVDLEDASIGATFYNFTAGAVGGTNLTGSGMSWVIDNSLTVSAPLDLGVGNNLTLQATVSGVSVDSLLNLNESFLNHLSASASFDVNSGGWLDLGPAGVFQLNAPTALYVNTGGVLDGNTGGSLIIGDSSAYVSIDGGSFVTPPGGSSVFASSSPGVVTPYFEVYDGFLDLQSGIFSGLDSNGLYIEEYVTIVNLANVTFTNATPGGNHISLYRNESSGDVTLTWPGLQMDDSFGPGSGYNIYAENYGSSLVTIEVSGAVGAGVGDVNESEGPQTVINWGPGGGGGFPSATEFTDALGGGMTDYVIGVNEVYVTVTDLDQDTNPGLVETVDVEITTDLTSDYEFIVLQETGPNTGVFRNTGGIPLVDASSTSDDGILQVCSSCILTVVYTDPDDLSDSTSDTADVLTSGGGGAGPIIDELEPDFGTTAGGSYVKIWGQGFDSGATVTIGGSAANGVTVVGSELITCYAPSGSVGPTSLVVTNPDTSSDSRVFFYSTPSSVTGSAPSGTSAADYRMVSVPGFITAHELGEALESSLGPWDPASWRCFNYEPEWGGYEEKTPSVTQYDESSPTGSSFWLLSRNGGTISVNTLTTATMPDIEVHFDAGWNQIGNPYSAPVSWGAVLVQDIDPSTGDPNGPPVPATSSPVIDHTLFYWNGSDYVSSSMMVPGAGYWMYNASGHEIEIIYQNPGGATKPNGEPEFTPLQAPSIAPPPPPGATLTSSGGGGSASAGGVSGSSGTTYTSGGGGMGASSAGGGGGGGGCWVEKAGWAGVPAGLLVVLTCVLLCLAGRRAGRFLVASE